VTSNNACEANEQLIILTNGDDKSDLMISIVACRHTTVWSFAHLPLRFSDRNSGTTHSGSVYSVLWGKTCVGTILPSFEHNWL